MKELISVALLPKNNSVEGKHCSVDSHKFKPPLIQHNTQQHRKGLLNKVYLDSHTQCFSYEFKIKSQFTTPSHSSTAARGRVKWPDYKGHFVEPGGRLIEETCTR